MMDVEDVNVICGGLFLLSRFTVSADETKQIKSKIYCKQNKKGRFANQPDESHFKTTAESVGK